MNYPVYPQNYPQYPTYPTPMQYQQPMMAQQLAAPQTPVQTAQQPVVSSSVVNVRSEAEAMNWPVAPNNSVTFVDEFNGYLYTKTSFNQFDRPQFVKYKLVREDTVENAVSNAAGAQGADVPYALKDDVKMLAEAVQGVNNTVTTMKSDIEKMSNDLYGIAGKKKSATVKKEPDED